MKKYLILLFLTLCFSNAYAYQYTQEIYQPNNEYEFNANLNLNYSCNDLEKFKLDFKK